ncbi:MAG: hypothetical protein ABMA64_00365 [Myxococcota bacterium]
MLLLLSSIAFANDWYLESAERADRVEPERVEKLARDAGFDASVVRRHDPTAGWRYLVRVDGFADAASAEVAAREIGAEAGIELGVVEVGPDGSVIGPAREAEAPAGVDLQSVLDAHHLRPGLGEKLRTGPVAFAFRRTLPDGRVVDHRWAAMDGALYCQIVPVEGDVVASKTRVVGDRAVASIDGADWAEQSGGKARDLLESLGPTSVIPLVLTLADQIDRREFTRLVAAPSQPGVQVWVFEGDAVAGPMRLEIGADDHRVRRVTFDEALTYEFSDYTEEGEIVYPGRVVTRRDGGIIDDVRVNSIAIDPKLPPEWFAPLPEISR